LGEQVGGSIIKVQRRAAGKPASKTRVEQREADLKPDKKSKKKVFPLRLDHHKT